MVLHEFGHGLGFANFVDEASGTRPSDLGDIFSAYTLDVSTGKRWNDMTISERQASAINVRKVSWDGLYVTAVPSVLSPGEPSLVATPAGVSGHSPWAWHRLAQLVAPWHHREHCPGARCGERRGPLHHRRVHAADHRAQLTGRTCCSTGDAPSSSRRRMQTPVHRGPHRHKPVTPGWRCRSDDSHFLGASLTAGNAIKAAPWEASVVWPSTSHPRRTDRPRLMMPQPSTPWCRASISHYEAAPATSLQSRDQRRSHPLVEPPQDLTLSLMRDIGWFSDHDGVPDGRDACLGSAQTPTVVIQACVSTAPNTVFVDGCRTSDKVASCAAGATSHDSFVTCVAHLANDLKKAGIITGSQKGSPRPAPTCRASGTRSSREHPAAGGLHSAPRLVAPTSQDHPSFPGASRLSSREYNRRRVMPRRRAAALLFPPARARAACRSSRSNASRLKPSTSSSPAALRARGPALPPRCSAWTTPSPARMMARSSAFSSSRTFLARRATGGALPPGRASPPEGRGPPGTGGERRMSRGSGPAGTTMLKTLSRYNPRGIHPMPRRHQVAMVAAMTRIRRSGRGGAERNVGAVLQETATA